MVAEPIIIGIDPGLMTGMSTWIGGLELESTVQWDAKTVVAHVWHTIEAFGLRRSIHVVCERYDITPQTARMSRQYDALHVIGALRFKCEIFNDRTNTNVVFVQYGRSDAKKFASDDRLRSVGWHRPGNDHANDASRQVMMHLGTVQPEVLKQLLARR